MLKPSAMSLSQAWDFFSDATVEITHMSREPVLMVSSLTTPRQLPDTKVSGYRILLLVLLI